MFFFKLIDKYFNQYNTLHKIFNGKTLKISYSCTNNFLKMINNYNMEVIRKYYDQLDGNNNNNSSSSSSSNNNNNNNNSNIIIVI